MATPASNPPAVLELPPGFPTAEAVERPTEEEGPPPDQPGEYTDELSDLTDEADDARRPSATAASGWLRRVRPLLKNKRVRVFAAANLGLLLLNALLLLGLLAVGVLALVSGVRVRTALNADKPCLFEFTEWSACSGTWTTPGQPNTRRRSVIPETIVHARGAFARDAPCPAGIESFTVRPLAVPPTTRSLQEEAPCNTHACPRPLSSFAFRPDCWRRNASDPAAGCFRIRNVTTADLAVRLDVTDLTRDYPFTHRSPSIAMAPLTKKNVTVKPPTSPDLNLSEASDSEQSAVETQSAAPTQSAAGTQADAEQQPQEEAAAAKPAGS
ncbi:hypothetical protein M3Y99_01536700 [Aphelenchoides fujianensis]|nr:hypothetical protein M3Y99_01536700 [Aphelenchoides fujianensis]